MITPLNSICNSGAHIPAQPSVEGANQSRKVGNYAQLPRAGEATPSPTHPQTRMSKRRLSNTPNLITNSNHKTVSLVYHPTFCVRARRWLCAFRFDCLSCCDAFPSISSTLALPLFFFSPPSRPPPSLYFTPGIVTPSKQRPGHSSETAGQKYGCKAHEKPEGSRTSLELLHMATSLTGGVNSTTGLFGSLAKPP